MNNITIVKTVASVDMMNMKMYGFAEDHVPMSIRSKALVMTSS